MPTSSEFARAFRVNESDLAQIEHFSRAAPYESSGFKVWGVSDRSKPRLLAYQPTSGIGVHRFDAGASFAYISSEMAGYVGNILVIYDMRNPNRPEEIARWLPGQHTAGGEKATWSGQNNRLHHALCFGERGAQPSPRAAPGGPMSLRHERPPEHAAAPLGQCQMSELDSPWSRTPSARFGAHQPRERMDDTLVYCTWFSGGLRVIDVKDPLVPEDVAWFVPEPCGGSAAPQSNDVDLDHCGLIYLMDRNCGFDVLEFEG